LNRLGVAHECDGRTDGQVTFGNTALEHRHTLKIERLGVVDLPREMRGWSC